MNNPINFTAGLLAVAATMVTLTAAPKPNVIIVFNDDMGYRDLGCFGAPKIKTPRVDKMATEGMKFTDFYVASPVCSASRASLLTGCYHNRVGVSGVFFPNKGHTGLAPKHVTMAEVLKTVGYKTKAVGKWHLGDEKEFLPTNQGFDSYFGIPYSNDMTPAESMAYSKDCLFREGFTPEKLLEGFKNKKTFRRNFKDKVPLMRDEQCVEFPADQRTITKRFASDRQTFAKGTRVQPECGAELLSLISLEFAMFEKGRATQHHLKRGYSCWSFLGRNKLSHRSLSNSLLLAHQKIEKLVYAT